MKVAAFEGPLIHTMKLSDEVFVASSLIHFSPPPLRHVDRRAIFRSLRTSYLARQTSKVPSNETFGSLQMKPSSELCTVLYSTNEGGKGGQGKGNREGNITAGSKQHRRSVAGEDRYGCNTPFRARDGARTNTEREWPGWRHAGEVQAGLAEKFRNPEPWPLAEQSLDLYDEKLPPCFKCILKRERQGLT